jgi:CheY-like chemotaxis protein
VVDDGRAAVAAVLGGAYDLVLMDVEMPVMDGLAATREIRKHRDADELPIVALTAHAASEEADRCRSAGMNDFLPKPFKAHRLYEVIERWSRSGTRSILDLEGPSDQSGSWTLSISSGGSA